MELNDNLRSKCKRISFSMVPFDAWIFVETLSQLPKDAIIAAVSLDHIAMRWNMMVISDKFEKVADGMVPPEIIPRIDGVNKKVELVMPITADSFMSELESL